MGCAVSNSGVEISTNDGGELWLCHIYDGFQLGGGVCFCELSTFQRGGGREVNVYYIDSLTIWQLYFH